MSSRKASKENLSLGESRQDARPFFVARPAGLEPATYGFEVRRSVQLSYGRIKTVSPEGIVG